MKHSPKISIAIDGPAASGKSTTARLVARELGLLYIDTGAMYRAITLAVLRNNIDPSDENQIVELARRTKIDLFPADSGVITLMNSENVSEAIRNPAVNKIISKVSAHSKLREIMVEKQRYLARDGGIVMEGRDIGTTVLPGAQLKIFLHASITERARRRFEELKAKGIKSNLQVIEDEIRRRDELDATRQTAPLQPAKDAILLDTSQLSISDQVAEVLNLVKTRKLKGN